MTQMTIRKTTDPTTDADGNLLIGPDLRITARPTISNQYNVLPGNPAPSSYSMFISIEDLAARKTVMTLEMSIPQWIALQESAITGQSLQDAPVAALRMPPVGYAVGEADERELPHTYIAQRARDALTIALEGFAAAVEDLEALHSEKAGRTQMADGIRAARSAIDSAAGNVEYANQVLAEHVAQTMQVMLADDRFAQANITVPG